MSIAALLLAAGESSRMGQLKALLPWQGVPLIQYQVDALRAAGADPVIVVLGHRREELLPSIPASALVVVNPDYQQGRSTSVKVGLQAVKPDVTAVALLGVDQPRSPELLRRLLQAHREGGGLITRPIYQGRHGHPVLFSTALLPELLTIDEERQGLREVVHQHTQEVYDVPVDTDEVLRDLNRPEDYRAAVSNRAGILP